MICLSNVVVQMLLKCTMFIRCASVAQNICLYRGCAAINIVSLYANVLVSSPVDLLVCI